MGFVRSVLAPGEALIVHTHPHWRRLVRPALVAIIGAGLAGIAGGFIEVQVAHPGDRTATWSMVAGLYTLIVLRFGVWPAVRWARTDLVVTDERVLYRPAGSNRRCVDVPLRRISAVRFRHTLADRALGTGCLILELGHLPPVEIDHVPEVARVHAAVYDELLRLPPRRLLPRCRRRPAFAGASRGVGEHTVRRENMDGVNDDSRIRRNPLGTPVVAMIGGGQLARMTHQAAVALGQSLRVLAADPQDPAAQVTPDVVIGAHDDPDAVRTAAEGADVMTFDHEHVPPQILLELEADGVAVRPRASALIHAQDKLVMRRALAEIGAPVPPFTGIDSLEDVRRFHGEQEGRIVLKSARGGYDGRGVWMPDSLDEAERIAEEQLAAGVPMMAEARVPWTRELSAMVARSPYGQGAVWPVVETVQRDGICAVVVAPATGLDDDLRSAVQATALRLAEHLDVTGVMAVELFEVIGADGRPGVLVNELAMRPHNSGHWTMDGAVTSQFEQHLRAVLDYPLGSTVATAPVTVMANVLGASDTPAMSMDERVHHLGARFPHAKVHLYGKSERPGRKLGHVNVLSDPGVDPDDADRVATVRAVAELAAHWLSHGEWADGWDPHTGAPVGNYER